MKEKERISFMRLATDVVNASPAVDLGRLSLLQTLQKKYGVSASDIYHSAALTLADAIGNLQQAPENVRQNVFDDMVDLLQTDHLYTRKKAVYMLMLMACFTDKLGGIAKVFSAPAPDDVQCDDTQMVYIEGDYFQRENEEIVAHYREIVNELRLIGFHFVYLPQVRDSYANLPKEDFDRLVTFLYPTLPPLQKSFLVEQMKDASTADFCKKQVVSRLGLSTLAEAQPSLVLMIGSAVVGGKTMNRFLSIPIEMDVLPLVQRLARVFANVYQSNLVCPSLEHTSCIPHTGSYKLMLDSYALCKGVSTVLVDFVHETIELPEVGVKLNKLLRREKALYALFLLESQRGG